MNTIGNRIVQARKLQGLTQEELAESAKVNLRTIQRVEKGEGAPRGKTLSLICQVLELELASLLTEKELQEKKSFVAVGVEWAFLALLNMSLMLVYGYLTLDSEANTTSRIAAQLLSFFLSYFIVSKTKTMSGHERLLKFGSGFICYFFATLALQGFAFGFVNGLFTAMAISLTVLYYGGSFEE